MKRGESARGGSTKLLRGRKGVRLVLNLKNESDLGDG